jgi:YD repeat-containing protein
MDNAFGQLGEYCPDGRLRNEISLDKDDRPMNDRAGNSKMIMSYDPAGNMISAEALDATGRPIDLKDPNWQRITREYDALGNVVEEAYWHADGTPAEDDDCYRKKFAYNERGNILQQVYLEANGQPKDQGFAVVEYQYDKNDRLTEQRFFDQKGRRLQGPNGPFHIHQSYDGDGKVIETAFFDDTEKPTLGRGGYHKEQMSVNGNGHLIQHRVSRQRRQPRTARWRLRGDR